MSSRRCHPRKVKIVQCVLANCRGNSGYGMATIDQIGTLFDQKTASLKASIKEDIADIVKKFDEKLDTAMSQLRGEFMEELQK